MKKYDSIIFGNGFNCAVDNELAKYSNKQFGYLFSLKEFLLKLLELSEVRFKTLYDRLKRY